VLACDHDVLHDTFLAPEVHTTIPDWLPGRWARNSPDGHSELTLVTSAGVARGELVWVALDGRPKRGNRYVIERRGSSLVLLLMLPEREGPTPYRLREDGPCLVPAERRLCFHRHGARPGPDVVQLFIDRTDLGPRLHIRTGFGPQHGAKVFEDLLLDKAPEFRTEEPSR
jgi:hypothetical protein